MDEKLNLMLFAEGADAAGSDAGTAETGGTEVPDAAAETTETPEENFESLIKGKYKADFDSRVQQIINQRFKETKTLQEEKEKASPIFEALAKRYGKETTDYEGMLNGLMDDDDIAEAEALRLGVTTDEYKARIKFEAEQSKMRNENERLRSELAMRERAEQDAEARRNMLAEVDRVKAIYPSFDLETEAQNQKFVDFFRRGIGMQNAYELAHRDEIMTGAMQRTAQAVSEQVVNNIKAKNARPAENGTTGKAPSTVRSNVAALTRAEREELSRRALRGERITFD